MSLTVLTLKPPSWETMTVTVKSLPLLSLWSGLPLQYYLLSITKSTQGPRSQPHLLSKM